jgi:hypothetical protein
MPHLKSIDRLPPNKPFQPTASRPRSLVFEVIVCSALATAERQGVGRRPMIA